MSQADELLTQVNTTLNAALSDGIDTLSRDEVVVFQRYVRIVLPLDGFVFWVKPDASPASSKLNDSQLDVVVLDGTESGEVAQKKCPFAVRGSLHYAEDKRQSEDETVSVATVVLTTTFNVQQLSRVSPTELWIGTLPTGQRYAFSRRGPLYGAAGLFHYVGEALYPALASQIIDSSYLFAVIFVNFAYILRKKEIIIHI